jgi:hypothetical protein
MADIGLRGKHRNKSESRCFDVYLTGLSAADYLWGLIGLMKTYVVKSVCIFILRA